MLVRCAKLSRVHGSNGIFEDEFLLSNEEFSFAVEIQAKKKLAKRKNNHELGSDVFLQVRGIPEIEAEREVHPRLGEVGHLHGANRNAGEFIVGKDRPSLHSQRARMDGDSDDFIGVG